MYSRGLQWCLKVFKIDIDMKILREITGKCNDEGSIKKMNKLMKNNNK
jgi:hypothetical protein